MPNLPPSTDFTNSAVTEGGFKTAITNLREYLGTLFGSDGLNITALATLGAMFSSLSTKNSNYTVIASDLGKIIKCTSTLEIALTSASTLGSSFSFIVSNTGVGTVTINPSGAETIDGEAVKELGENESAVVYCDGTNFYTLNSGSKYFGSNTIIFASSGTWVVPKGVTQARVTVVAGGGGGSNASGGSGGMAVGMVYDLEGTIDITVGAGGNGVYGGGTTAGAGGASSFGSYITATGGAGGSGVSGASGVGTVTTGTPIRNSSNASEISGVYIPYIGGSISNGSDGTKTWSVTSSYRPGAYGSSLYDGGVSGVVIIEF